MPTYKITSPDGRVFRVTVPEGVTKEEVLAQIAGQYTPPAPPESRPGAALGAGMWRGLAGTADLLTGAVANPLNYVGRQMGLDMNLDPAPASRFGEWALGQAGMVPFEPRTPSEERWHLGGEVLGASAAPGLGVASRATAPGKAVLTELMAAGGAAGGAVGGRELFGAPGELVGSLVGGTLTPSAPRSLAQRFVTPQGQPEMRRTLEASERQGVPVTVGEAAGGSFFEKSSSTLPGGARAAETFAENRAAQFGRRVDELVENLTPVEATAESAGRNIRQGIDEWSQRFREQGELVFGRFNDLMPPDTPVFNANTSRVFYDLDKNALADILNPSVVKQLSERMGSLGTYPVQFMRDARSALGRALTDPSLIPDMPRGTIKRLYEAITTDIKHAAGQQSPEALEAFETANKYWREGIQKVDDFLDPIYRRKTPEAVYKAAMQGSNEGVSRLRTLKETLSPSQWEVVVATVLRRLGKERASSQTTGELGEEAIEAFSPETFLTNLNKLDPQVQDALFNGTSMLRRDVGDLMRIAQGVRSQRQMSYNPSGTAGALANLGTLGGVLGFANPMQAARMVGGIGANALLQEAMQSPAVANYLARPTQFTPHMLPQAARVGVVTGPDLLSILSQTPPEGF